MKKIMTFLSMIALAFVGTMMIGCSNKEYDIEKPEQPVESENVITLTTTISFPDADTDTDETKALDVDYGNKIFSKTFAIGEKMCLIYGWGDGLTTDESDPLTAEDITNGGKTAKFTFQVYSPKKTVDVTYVYPAAMVGGNYPDYHIDYSRLNTQDGTLASISSGLDLATFTGPWDGDNLPSANLTNELAIIAYTLKNADGSVDLTSSITGMTINDGTNNYTVNRYAAAGPIYVAIRPTNNATINYTATDGTTNNYKKTVSEKTYEAGKFSQLGLRMAPSSSATGYALKDSHVGDVVGSDGLAYAPADRNNLPAYASVAGMVAYKDGVNGLVIALSDESNIMKWPEAVSAAIAHTPAVTGHAWRMPSLSEWKQMFAAFGSIETSSTGLNTAITNAGGNTLDKIHYWTSTDKEGNPANAYYIGLSGSNVTYSYDKGKATDYSYARACFAFDPDLISGVFSVSDNQRVQFARGNLTYTSNGWALANNSWEYSNTVYGKGVGSHYFSWNDVFNSANSGNSDIQEDVIKNGLGSYSWRALSLAEWRYLLGYNGSPFRTVSWHRYAKIKGAEPGIEDKRYLLIFPDFFKETDWTAAMGQKPSPSAFDGAGQESIAYTESNFAAMQTAGIVILPAAGAHYSGGNPPHWYEVGITGYYWTSTTDDASGYSFRAYNVYFDQYAESGQVDDTAWPKDGSRCYSVRLVQNK